MNKFPELIRLDQKNLIVGPYEQNETFDSEESDIKDISPGASKQENAIEQSEYQNKSEGAKVDSLITGRPVY